MSLQIHALIGSDPSTQEPRQDNQRSGSFLLHSKVKASLEYTYQCGKKEKQRGSAPRSAGMSAFVFKPFARNSNTHMIGQIKLSKTFVIIQK